MLNVRYHAARIVRTLDAIIEEGFETRATSGQEDWLEALPSLRARCTAAENALGLLLRIDPAAVHEACWAVDQETDPS